MGMVKTTKATIKTPTHFTRVSAEKRNPVLFCDVINSYFCALFFFLRAVRSATEAINNTPNTPAAIVASFSS